MFPPSEILPLLLSESRDTVTYLSCAIAISVSSAMIALLFTSLSNGVFGKPIIVGRAIFSFFAPILRDISLFTYPPLYQNGKSLFFVFLILQKKIKFSNFFQMFVTVLFIPRETS